MRPRRCWRRRRRRRRHSTAHPHGSEQVLEGSFQAAPVALAYLDRDFTFVRVNDRYAAADGRKADFFTGKHHFDLYPNADNERLFQRVRDTGEPHVARAKPFVYEHNPERGITHWDWTLTPVKDHRGHVTALVLALNDVTERIEALSLAALEQRTASAAEQRLREVIDTTSALFALCGPDGTLLEINRAALELTGTSRASLVGQPVWAAGRWARDGVSAAEVRRAVRAASCGEHVRCELALQRADRREATVDTTFSPMRDATGVVTGVVATGIDVTEQHAALRELEVRDAALESSLSAFCMANLDGTVLHANTAFLRMWELSDRAQAIGRSVDEFWEDPQQARDALAAVFTNGVWIGQLVARVPGHGPRLMRVSAALVRDAGGEPIRVMASFLDVTDAEAAALHAQQQLAEKELLLKEIHHRVKNNLQVTSSLLRLQANHAGDARLKSLLEESQGRIRAMSLVHETLYQSINLGRVDFAHYAGRLVRGLCSAYATRARQIETTLDVCASPLAIDVAVPCGLVTNELVSNALKHAFEGRTRGQVSVTLTESKGQAELTVRDDGVGMAEEPRHRGLGLQLVYTLAQQLGGEIAIRPGSGTSVSLLFPTQRAQAG